MHKKNPSDYFASISFFQEFEKKYLKAIELHSLIKHYKPKDKILIQGQENINLYILLIGQVGVLVDGLVVATLEQMGDIVGEMSVVTGRPVSATIVAETPVKVMEVDITGVNNHLVKNKEEFNEALFRAFAVTLSDKLRVTNQKAKYFEEFSDKHLSEIYQGQELTIKRLSEITNKNLVVLSETLQKISKNTEAKDIQKARQEVQYIQKTLEPIVSRFDASFKQKHKKVLLAESNKKQQAIAKMAMGGTGIELDIATVLEEAREKLSVNSYDIVFVSADMIPLIGEFSEKDKTHFTLMTSEPISTYIPSLQNLKSLPNIVSRDPEDRYFTSKNIMTTLTKLATDDIFGLEKYLAWGVDIHEFTVKSSEERKDLNDNMHEYFINLGVRASRLDSVSVVAEELLMNSIYDAPTDESGKSLYNQLDRTVPVLLKESEYASFSFGTDGMFIGISVADPFGALNGDTVIDYLESCYEGNAGSLNKQKGGAGRGLHMIVEMSDLVVFNIKPKFKTEVIALFHLGSKKSADYLANFHYFCADDK
ncbi:MAG: cyclic nucleotide-binding domain-containing protein [Bdellovibrionales bacterium]|nr:cyclic nucleotide-binding domain-containing protein [Bdellovibrionales bacterium]